MALTCEGNRDDAHKRAESVYDPAGGESAASPETHSRVPERLQSPVAPRCSSLGGCAAGIIHELAQRSAPQDMGGVLHQNQKRLLPYIKV
ncbi:hypothetical protein EYF80_013933 [Liparis tanakae]|uniref:Uncharacterized protein n=1 Tax=Liparis tanakae TaxID=230148 RepID=A0A4Z2ICW8_9TELE|nr:hypothetical protein EYF80_013933 [Liparis tanakae]